MVRNTDEITSNFLIENRRELGPSLSPFLRRELDVLDPQNSAVRGPVSGI
jgi:hypothetical protein